jgi:hypothetical protein
MTVTLRFMFDRETKGAIRYEEIAGLDEGTVQTLYLRKKALRLMGVSRAPKELTITLDISD